MQSIPDDLLSVNEMCAMIPGIRPGKRLNLATAYLWIRKGRIRAWRINHRYMVSRADVLALLEPVTVQPDLPERDRYSVPPEIVEANLRRMGIKI